MEEVVYVYTFQLIWVRLHIKHFTAHDFSNENVYRIVRLSGQNLEKFSKESLGTSSKIQFLYVPKIDTISCNPEVSIVFAVKAKYRTISNGPGHTLYVAQCYVNTVWISALRI